MNMKSFGQLLLSVSLVLFAPPALVSVGVAQEPSPGAGETRFSQYQGRYAVSFPFGKLGQPLIHTPANEMSAEADIDGTSFIVACADLQVIDRPPGSTGTRGPAEHLFHELDAYTVRVNHAKIVRQAALDYRAFPGREAEFEADNGWQRIVRHYLVGNRLYCLAVEPREGKLNREMVQVFLRSFTLLEGNAPPPTAMPAPSAAPSAAPAPPSQQTKTPEHRYVNPSGRYVINFPGSPTESKPATYQGRVVYQALQQQGGVAYAVRYVDLPASELDRARALLDGQTAFYLSWKDEIESDHGKLKHERRVWVAGRAAYDSEFVWPDGTHLIGRTVVVHGRAFRIGVVGSGITADSPQVRQFLDSFAVIE